MSDSKRSRPDTSPDNPTLKRNRSEETPKALNVAGNRRMFGALMGHLGRAQKKLDADSEVINMQVARRQEATQKNDEESKRVAKLQRTLSVEQKEKELILRDTMLLRKTKSRLQSRTTIWKKLQSPLAHSLVTTSTEPRISWLPKTHNETTQALLDKRKLEIEEEVLRREADDAEELRVAEEAMVTAREGILEAQRRKNAEWEARQAELEALKGAGGRREQEEGNEDEEREPDQGSGSDEDVREQTKEAEEEEEEEEEEEDILAALDGRIRARKSAETEREEEEEAVKEATTGKADVLTEEVEDKEEQATSLSEPAVTTATTSTSDESNSKDETGDVAAPDSTGGDTNEEGQSTDSAPTPSSVPLEPGRKEFDYETEARDLLQLTVAQLKSVGADEGVVFRKGKMLKKHYVEDICQARQQRGGE